MDYRFRAPTARPEDRGAWPPRYRRGAADGMITGGRFDSRLLIPRAPG